MKTFLLKNAVAASLVTVSCFGAAQAACTATYVTRDDWVNGFVVDVTVVNSGSSPVTGWKVDWNYNNPVYLVSNPWGAAVAINGNAVSSTSDGTSIAAGGSYYFGLAVKYDSASKPTPGAITVSGTGCVDAKRPMYADPLSTAALWVNSHPSDGRAPAISQNIVSKPAARWFGDWSGDITTAVKAHVDAADKLQQKPVLVAYNIPGRDCGQYSAGGSNSIDGYKTWIRGFATGIGNREAIVILEPDALPQLDCLSDDGKKGRLDMLQYAVSQFKALSGKTKVFLDIGNSVWLSTTEAATRLNNAGISNAYGFSLNVSNFRTDAETNPYGSAVSAELKKQIGVTKAFVVDTSRNGVGPLGTEWCDPAGRQIGLAPTEYAAGHQPEMTLWVKSPGESDGCAAAAGTFAPELAYKLIYGYY